MRLQLNYDTIRGYPLLNTLAKKLLALVSKRKSCSFLEKRITTIFFALIFNQYCSPEGVHRSWKYCNTRSMRGVDGASSYSNS